jgi:hypothetical protein
MTDPANRISEHNETTGPGGETGVSIHWLKQSQPAQGIIIVSK